MRSRLFGFALLLAMSSAPAFASPLCYDAHGGNEASQAALKRAIVTLLIPPVGIMLGLVGFAFRYDRRGRRQQDNE